MTPYRSTLLDSAPQDVLACITLLALFFARLLTATAARVTADTRVTGTGPGVGVASSTANGVELSVRKLCNRLLVKAKTPGEFDGSHNRGIMGVGLMPTLFAVFRLPQY